MKSVSIVLISLILILHFSYCKESEPQKNFLKFNEEFFLKYVPELPKSRLLQKSDLPLYQQQFFDEAGGQLQLLADLNKNDIPEYIVIGVADQSLLNKIKKPYFIAIFERQETGIKRNFFQQLYIPPVDINVSNNSVIISFAFYSDYGAEIYFENGKYRLDRW